MHMYLGEVARLSLQVSDGSVGLYPRATVYGDGDSALDTVDLVHIGGGLYRAEWTPSSAGVFDISYKIFTDSGHTSPANFERITEQIKVDLPDEQVNLGVVYDHGSSILRFNVFLLRFGRIVSPAALSGVVVQVYSHDGTLVLAGSDTESDDRGVYHVDVLNPDIIVGGIYVAKISIETSTHTVSSERGFKVII